MTRHSKNCTANSVYSYHEKQKDARASGFGSLKLRFSKDAVKDYDCCCLTLHPCREPVLTPDGFLFDKEAILEYIVAKKSENRRKLKEYEKQCKKEKAELEELSEAEQRSKLEKFLKEAALVNASSAVAHTSNDSGASVSKGESSSIATASVSNMSSGKAKTLPSFWIPSLTPENAKSKLQKPDKTVPCPMSGLPLRLKELVPVKFTAAEDGLDGASLEGRRDRYKCPVTGDFLGNHVPCAILRPTGDVVTMQCVELIKKDMTHPLTGQKLTEKDIIPLQRGGTGFASVNDSLVAEKARPVMQT